MNNRNSNKIMNSSNMMNMRNQYMMMILMILSKTYNHKQTVVVRI